MFRHLLLPTDGSDLSVRSATSAIQLAKTLSARVTALVVSEPFHLVTASSRMMTASKEDYEREAAAEAERWLQPIREAARAAEVPVNSVHVYAGRPADAIIDQAMLFGCDLIAMASHGVGGLKAAILGSQTGAVLARSDIPVLVRR